MADKKQVEYVLSAINMMRIYDPKPHHPWYDNFAKATNQLTDLLKAKLKNECKNIDPLVSILFNAFTETGYMRFLPRLNNIHADAVYADSGGLQIVTAGRSVTEDIKKEIYQTQTYADYAMCFDVIPLEIVSATRTKQERSNTSNKLFNSSKHNDSAILTGKNVQEQCRAFREANAKTKVIVIVQGNNAQDMVDFYRGIMSCLEPADLDYVGGLALADTCMGNGELESVEMLRAAHLISKECPEQFKRHLHLLGVGSINRLRPVLYLIKSGYLDSFNRISFDSTTHTSTFMFGQVRCDGKTNAIGSYLTPEVDKHFREVYQFWGELFTKYVTEDDFIKNVFGDKLGENWTFGKIRDRIFESTDEKVLISTMLCNMAHVYFQVYNFMINLDKIMENKLKYIKTHRRVTISDIAINGLLAVETDEQLLQWIRNNKSHIKSKRITRDEQCNLLEFCA